MFSVAREANSGIDLVGTDLTGSDWSAFDFTVGSYDALLNSKMINTDFRGANLAGSNFRKVDLADANLRSSNLTKAVLAGSNLYNALLGRAILTSADLRGANLVSAELNEVTIEGANFAEARFGSTAIVGLDLSGGIGLDQAVHISPSPVDSHTFKRTAAGLKSAGTARRSEVLRFLSNAGFGDDFLSVFRSSIDKPIEFYSVFLSHSSLDKEFARKLYTDLRAIGVECWFDEHQMLPGYGILDEIDRGVKLWDKLILVCSLNSLSQRTGWWVEQELERALRKEREERAAKGSRILAVIPITIDSYIFDNWESPFRATVLERSVGDFRDWRDPQMYTKALERLVAAVGRERYAPGQDPTAVAG